MERGDFFSGRALHEKLSLRLPKLFNRRETGAHSAQTLTASRGLALLFIAIVFAWISIEVTENQATESYRKTHWPRPTVWSQTLLNRGLSQQKNLGAFTGLLKTHPAPFTQEQKIWASHDGCVVYLPRSAFGSEPELWTCEKAPSPSGWTLMGAGLAGFEKLTDFFESTPKKAKASPRASLYKIDPKEFRY